ncbi:TIGR03943 family protein [Salinibacterium sp. SYSU T00001]|uniref:TIGR03943 family putative permease subunit n=1 Tax=Homoserinimonas sedimenticola TaxID=2986805 RepID=UPI002235CF85|nr:TIGR03943 family protein [Salinibacterium sedimenticola]MCW4384654.1 TIGR03943 family protein [Salinibacterium sedimenticola]
MSSDEKHGAHAHAHHHEHGGTRGQRVWDAWRRWQGLALAAAVLVSTLWLAATGQLVLYIHPRYVVFTVAMALIGVVFVVAGLVAGRGATEGEQPRRLARAASLTGSVLAGALALALVIIPPATLTTATASQREINSTALGEVDESVTEAASVAGASASFTVLDWASLLRQTSDRAFYADKPAEVLGFITPDSDDPENSFYVSRFKVTCCAVDAQPVGVPVYLPDWQGEFSPDAWVEVTGTFDTNPSRGSAQPLALIPEEIVPVDQPEEPYLY